MFRYFSPGLFLFIFCLTLLLQQVRLVEGCPRWLNPVTGKEQRAKKRFPAWVNGLLILGVVVGLVFHYVY